MTTLHDFVVRTIPAAVGTALYAFTQLGLVAWLTCIWVSIQIIRFSIDWYRQEKAHRKKVREEALQLEKHLKDYP